MSYARFGHDNSDVYVFAHIGGYVQCCGCMLAPSRDVTDDWNHHSAQSIVDHLLKHVEAGHTVPSHLLDKSVYDDDDFVL